MLVHFHRPIPAFWVLALFTIQHQILFRFQPYKLNKHKCWAWDSKPGLQDGRRRQIHWAMSLEKDQKNSDKNNYFLYAEEVITFFSPFSIPFYQNLSPRTFKNQSICSHWFHFFLLSLTWHKFVSNLLSNKLPSHSLPAEWISIKKGPAVSNTLRDPQRNSQQKSGL